MESGICGKPTDVHVAPSSAAPSQTAAPVQKESAGIKKTVASALDFNFTDKTKGVGKFFNDLALMRPIDVPVAGAIANTVRQPLVAARGILDIWIKDPNVLQWADAAGNTLIKQNAGILTERTFRTAKLAVL